MATRLTLALVLGLTCPAPAFAQSATAPAQRFAYLIDLAGEVIKLDLVTGKPVYRRAIGDSLIGADSLTRGQSRPEVEGAGLDSSAPGVVVALPDSALGDEEGAARRYRVLYLSLPDLQPVARFDIPQPQRGTVELLVDPYRRRVLVLWEDTDHADTTGWTFHASALRLPDLKEVRRWVARSDRSIDGPPLPRFTHSSNQTIGSMVWVGPDSTILRHARGDIVFQGDSFGGRPEPALPRSPERVAATARAMGVDSTHILIGVPMDVRNGVVLWTSAPDTGRRTQYLQTGLAGSTQVRSQWVSPWGKANLLAAGRSVVVQPIEGPMRGSTTGLRMPGVLIFYDVASGQETGRMKVPELAGSFQLTDGVCSTSDERFLILRQPNGGIQIVEPGMLRARGVTLENPISIAAACFTSAK